MMRTIHVLVLEDDAASAKFIRDNLGESAIPNNAVNWVTRWDLCEKALKSERYDLVIADLWVYKDAKDEQNGGSGEFFCLDFLLGITESEEPPVPVIAYTGRHDIRSLNRFHNRICDFWDKHTQDADLYKFRMRKVFDLLERERRSTYFIRIMRDAISNRSHAGTPPLWSKEIVQMLDAYEEYHTHLDPISAMQVPLRTIASELKCDKSFDNAFTVLAGADAATSALIEKVRPHLYHSVNVFLLGYYLFNLTGIDWGRLLAIPNTWFAKELSRHGGDVDEALRIANGAWFLASLLHDVGIAIQYYDKIGNEMLNKIKSIDVTVLPKEIKKLQFIKDKFNAVNDTILSNSCVEVAGCLRTMEDTSDHGMGSCIYLGSQCSKEVKERLGESDAAIFTYIAAEAAGIHNMLDHDSLKKLDFATHPIAAMLVLCDGIQSWERQRLDFSVIKGEKIEKSELIKLVETQSGGHGPEISITVRYYPHLLVAHHKPSMDDCASKLQLALQKHVTAPLQKLMRFSGEVDLVPKFNVEFELSHQRLEFVSVPTIGKKQ
jgi:hypothetical protein